MNRTKARAEPSGRDEVANLDELRSPLALAVGVVTSRSVPDPGGQPIHGRSEGVRMCKIR